MNKEQSGFGINLSAVVMYMTFNIKMVTKYYFFFSFHFLILFCCFVLLFCFTS